MATIPPNELLALLARVVFVVLLYAFVLIVLFSLSRRLMVPAADVSANGSLAPADVQAVLTLVEAAPMDGPVGRVITVDRALVIGRHPQCDVVLRDNSISGRHARIVLTREGYQLEDLGSTNGTYINGKRVARPALLEPGDVIQTGTATWRLEA